MTLPRDLAEAVVADAGVSRQAAAGLDDAGQTPLIVVLRGGSRKDFVRSVEIVTRNGDTRELNLL